MRPSFYLSRMKRSPGPGLRYHKKYRKKTLAALARGPTRISLQQKTPLLYTEASVYWSRLLLGKNPCRLRARPRPAATPEVRHRAPWAPWRRIIRSVDHPVTLCRNDCRARGVGWSSKKRSNGRANGGSCGASVRAPKEGFSHGLERCGGAHSRTPRKTPTNTKHGVPEIANHERNPPCCHANS